MLKPQIQESEVGMEVTSYLPAELERAWASPDSPGAAPSAYVRRPHQGGAHLSNP